METNNINKDVMDTRTHKKTRMETNLIYNAL